MEAFSLLKFWRSNGGGGGVTTVFSGDTSSTAPSNTTTILTAVSPHSSDSDDSDGPFFDLEINDEEVVDNVNGESENEDEEEGDELNLMTFSTTSSGSSVTDPAEPSDDLFFKGRLVPVESNSSLLLNENETNSKFLVKTATKFRVLMLKLKKQRTNSEQKAEQNPEKSEAVGVNQPNPQPTPKNPEQKSENEKRLFTVRFKLVEEVNIKSLFTRDNSSKNKAVQKTNAEEDSNSNSNSNVDSNSNSSSSSNAEEKKFSKETMQKYLRMVKPLYIRVSKRYGEKLSLTGGRIKAAQAASPPPPQTTAEKAEKMEAEQIEATDKAVLSSAKSVKQGNLPAGLRVVRKHLSKSRSAPTPVVSSGQSSSRRRDDSLFQQQDGIQGAILHCKRSFNSTRDSNMCTLSRGNEAPHETHMNLIAEAKAERG